MKKIFILLTLLLVIISGCYNGESHNIEKENIYEQQLNKIITDSKQYQFSLKKAEEVTFLGEGIYINVLSSDNLSGYEGWYYYSTNSLLSLNNQSIEELLLLLAIAGPKNRVYIVHGDNYKTIFAYKDIEDTKNNGMPMEIGAEEIVKDPINNTEKNVIETGESIKAYLTEMPYISENGIKIKYKRVIADDTKLEFYNGITCTTITSINILSENTAEILIDIPAEELVNNYIIKSKDIFVGKYNKIIYEKEPFVSKINLSLDKKEIYSTGIDSIKIDAILIDQNGNIMQDKIPEIYINDMLIEGNLFSTTHSGIHTIYAKYGDIKSNIETVNATIIELIEYQGDFTVEASMTQEYLDSISLITGTLYCDSDIINLKMSNLKEVTGGINFEGAYSLKSLNMSGVEKLGKNKESYYLNNNFRYFSLRITDCYVLNEVKFSKLKETSNGIYIGNNGELEIVAMENLNYIGGDFYLHNNSLNTIKFEKLSNIIGNLRFYNENQIEEINFIELKNINNSLLIYNNNNLKSLKLNNLTNIENSIEISNCSKLKYIEMKNLIIVKYYLLLQNLNELLNIDFSNFDSTTHNNYSFYYENRHAQLSIEIKNCNRIEEINFPKLKNTAGGMYINGNSNLKKININELKVLGDSLIINNNNLIEEINFNSLNECKQDFFIRGEKSIKIIEMPNLFSIKNRLYISENENLEILKFNKIVSTGNEIKIYNNKSLKIIEMPKLKTITDYILIEGLPVLNDLNLNSLESVNYSSDYSYYDTRFHKISIILENCVNLEILSLPALLGLDGGMYITQNSSLKEINLPLITRFNDSPFLMNNSLEIISFPELVDFGQYFVMYNEPNIVELNIPNVISCNGSIKIYDNLLLNKVSMPKLNSITQDLYMKFATNGEIDLDNNISILGTTTLTNGIQN